MIKTPKRRNWRRFGVFIVNFENISHLGIVLLLLTLNMYLELAVIATVKCSLEV